MAIVCPLAAAAEFQPIAPDATSDQVLESLKTRGDTMKGFSANVKLTNFDNATADSHSDSGKFLFQKVGDDDARIRINFSQRTEGSKLFPEQHEYAVSNGWVLERDYQKRVETDRQVAKSGEKLNLLKLGQGPFPLPVGQDPADVKKQFDVTLIAPAKDDPAATVHLLLKPKGLTDMARKFAQIDVWVDRQNGMPDRIVTLDNTRENMATADLTDIRLDVNLTDADFALPQIPRSDWDVTSEPYRG
jgi:outer membrane lipoprotein-sorting protein